MLLLSERGKTLGSKTRNDVGQPCGRSESRANRQRTDAESWPYANIHSQLFGLVSGEKGGLGYRKMDEECEQELSDWRRPVEAETALPCVVYISGA